MLATIKYIIDATELSTQQAWWLLEFITDSNKAHLQFSTAALTIEQKEKLDSCIKLIADEHKPLAYILGWVPFLDLKIMVTPPTLIPRPETESWVHELITTLQKNKSLDETQPVEKLATILDIGTGSGCIALALAQAFPAAHIYAVDIAASAISLAHQNAMLNNISNITFLQSDLLDELPADLQFDLIVSNPPYINPTAQLDASVLNWEDHGALFARNQGMHIIEQIIQQAQVRLKDNQLNFQLIIEIDSSQGIIVKKLLEDFHFKSVEIRKDQFDRDRTAWAK